MSGGVVVESLPPNQPLNVCPVALPAVDVYGGEVSSMLVLLGRREPLLEPGCDSEGKASSSRA